MSNTSHDVPPISIEMRSSVPTQRRYRLSAPTPAAGPDNSRLTGRAATCSTDATPPFDCTSSRDRGSPSRRSSVGGTATRGGGTFERGQPARVSPITDPAHALIGTGFPFRDFERLDEYLAQFGRVVLGVTGIRRPGSAAIDLADVAAGRFEGFWEQRLSAWDIAAGILLVQEAGGRVTDREGRDLGVEHGEVIAGNPPIHDWLLGAVRGGT